MFMLSTSASTLKLSGIAYSGGELLSPPSEFQSKYNVESFMFNHELGNSPLFSVERLTAVAERMIGRGDSKNITTRIGKSSLADAKFRDMPLKQRLAETVARIEEANVWMKLSSANAMDPEYNEVMQTVLREVEKASGRPLLQDITWAGLTVFLASPGVVTPYHIDHESNFLFQIRGSKDVNLFDPRDPEVVPVKEIEDFYAGDFEAAKYRPELQNRASVFHLSPGKVVHQPPLAPHWVQNGPNVSISVSIGFCLKPLDKVGRVYQVNHFLRRFGVAPTPPGRSALHDGIKKAGIGLLSKSHPTNPDEILFSGLNRLITPTRAIKRLLRRSPAKS
jgi:hypothetical protein